MEQLFYNINNNKNKNKNIFLTTKTITIHKDLPKTYKQIFKIEKTIKNKIP